MKEIVIKLLKKALKEKGVDLKKEQIEKFLETPPSPEMGDFAFPCFLVAKNLKQEPTQIALEIRKLIGNVPTGFQDIQTSGPYINFFVDRKIIARDILKIILSKKDNFGKQVLGKGKKTMVEFSQPNTHKAFHVGHIRGTSLGESISRISEFCGEKIIRANYSGDTGMHIAKWIWCYGKYHLREKLKNNESWIASIYTDAIKRLKNNEKLQEEVDVINRVLEEKSDKELNKLWKKTRKMSIDSWKKIYKQLDVKFDVHFFESEVGDKAKQIVNKLLEKKIATISDDATIIDLKKYGLGIWVLLRSDGTILYSAKDLALAELKFNKFKINKSVYVVGAAQSLHISQLFKTLELLNFPNIQNFKFIPFLEVRLPSGKMSSRTGKNILYSDFIEEVLKDSKKRIKERIPKIKKVELEKRALPISIAAIKYAMLKQGPRKNIIFKKQDATKFEGDTGPYLLYSYARASSILRKVKLEKKQLKISNINLSEIKLVKKLSQFPEIVLHSYISLNPSLIANYSYQLAQTFNEFYHTCPVINSEQKVFRLKLVASFKQVLKNALTLLGIQLLEKM